jgi:hypothetical protein
MIMALDPLELAAWREQVDANESRAKWYRQQADEATTATDKLRLLKTAKAVQGRADRLRDFIHRKIEMERVKDEYAAMGERGF